MASFRDALPCKRSIIFCLYLLLSTHGVRAGTHPHDTEAETSGRLGKDGLLATTLTRLAQNMQANAQERSSSDGHPAASASAGLLSGLGGFRAGGGGGAGLLSGFGLSLSPFQHLGWGSDHTSQPRQTILSDATTLSDDLFEQLISSPVQVLTPEPLSPEMEELLRAASDETGQDPAERARAVATLGVLSATFLLVSGIMYTVSGGIGTLATSLALLPAGLATIVNPTNFFLSAGAFGSKLRTDAQSKVKEVPSKWIKGLTALADRLQAINNGTVSGQLANLRAQLADVQGLLFAATEPFTVSINDTLKG